MWNQNNKEAVKDFNQEEMEEEEGDKPNRQGIAGGVATMDKETEIVKPTHCEITKDNKAHNGKASNAHNGKDNNQGTRATVATSAASAAQRSQNTEWRDQEPQHQVQVNPLHGRDIEY